MSQSLIVLPPVQAPESTSTIRVLSVPFPAPQVPLCHLFYPLYLPPTPSNHPSVFYLYSFVLSEIFHKWSEKVYSLLVLSFSHLV